MMKSPSINLPSDLMPSRRLAPSLGGNFNFDCLFNPSFTNQTATRRTHKKGMKLKTLLTTLLGTFLLQHLAFGQTNVVLPDPPAVAVTNAVAADMVTNAPMVAADVTNQPDAMATNPPVVVAG